MPMNFAFICWSWVGILGTVQFYIFSSLILSQLYAEVAPSSSLDLPGSGPCSKDVDCSLNGFCNVFNGMCSCDKPWSGTKCEYLQFEPVQFPQGYGMTPNHTTWGGGILVEEKPEEGKWYHLYVVRMTNDCSLEHWVGNSRIDHAISTTPTGPYVFQDVAIPTQSHNPVPLKLPDGSFAIYHIGSGENGPNGGENCGHSDALLDTSRHKVAYSRLASNDLQQNGSTIHVSSSLYGPWIPLKHSLGKCNNPAPAIHPNGTIFVGCRFGKPQAVLKRADSIQGPYTKVGEIPHHTENGDTLEDPQLYIDHRGNFHILYHAYGFTPKADHCEDSLVSAHAYSVDGIEWHLSPTPPYGTRVQLTTGKSIILATRERPKPLLQNGKITHLVEAVCGSPNCNNSPNGCVDCKYKNWDFTLVSPLSTN